MRKKYASDISPEKFAQILPVLQSVRKRTKPTTVVRCKACCATAATRASLSGRQCERLWAQR